MFNLKKTQAGKRDLSPLLRLRFTHTGVKERNGDKSLFPACDFLIFGDLLHLGASYDWNQTSKRQRPPQGCNDTTGSLQSRLEPIAPLRGAGSMEDSAL